MRLLLLPDLIIGRGFQQAAKNLVAEVGIDLFTSIRENYVRHILRTVPDASDKTIYEWVGRALCKWEHIEFELSRLYSQFATGLPNGEAIGEYGSGQIFRSRIASVATAAGQYFIKNPCQAREGEFQRLTDETLFFADRRNEIAHSLVLSINGIRFFHEQYKIPDDETRRFYLLMPPVYLVRKLMPEGGPKFTYNTKMLSDMENAFTILSWKITDFLKALPLTESETP